MSESEDREALRSEIAHELKTPLAIIIGYSELLAYRDDEETRIEASRNLAAAAERLSKAVDDLVDRFLPRI